MAADALPVNPPNANPAYKVPAPARYFLAVPKLPPAVQTPTTGGADPLPIRIIPPPNVIPGPITNGIFVPLNYIIFSYLLKKKRI